MREARGENRRTGQIGTAFSGLLNGGFDKLGYIPVQDALGLCEGRVRGLVEQGGTIAGYLYLKLI